MNRFSRLHLSPEVAMHNLEAIDLEEKSRIAEGIALIAVLDERRDYLAASYSSMKRYCMGRLRMSEDKALRRIQVARVALRFPEVFECLADGRLSVSTAAVLAPHLKPETAGELLAAAAFRTRHEIVQMLAARPRPLAASSVASANESLVQPTSGTHAPGHAISLSDLAAPPSCDAITAEHAPAHVANSRRGRVSPSATGEYDVRLSITEAEHEDLRRALALLGHAVPSGDPALVYARAMKHYVVHLEKQRLGAKPGAATAANGAGGRGIPKALRRFVWERDGARCTFKSADGHRCEETGRLELDHILPVAMGGMNTADNCRVLCAAHNRYEAERVLGKEHVQGRRELAQRERARARVAAEADAARTKARDAASREAAAREAAAREAAAREAVAREVVAREVAAREAAAQEAVAREAAAREAATREAAAREAATRARHAELRADVHAALRGLGYRAAEARRGAALADSQPDASLEACVRLALAELSRPLVMRCERMARSTA